MVEVHTSCPICRGAKKVYRMQGESILGIISCPACVLGVAVGFHETVKHIEEKS